MFIFKILKQYIWEIYNKYKFYRKFKLLLGSSCYVPNVTNLTIGTGFTFGRNCEIYCQDLQSNITIKDHVAFNSGVTINADCQGCIEIGNNVLIGPNVLLRSSNHVFSDSNKPIRSQGHSSGKIIIEDDVWLGAGVIVLPNVTIGQGAIIGAGAVVAKSIPPKCIAMADGVVASLKKNRL